MGYFTEIKKINMSLNKNQQENIFRAWAQYVKEDNIFLGKLFYLHEGIKSGELTTLEDCLKELNFNYEYDNEIIKLIYCTSNASNLYNLFQYSSAYITPGSYISWKDEYKKFYGWFFDGTIKEYFSNKELKSLQEKFNLTSKETNEN